MSDLKIKKILIKDKLIRELNHCFVSLDGLVGDKHQDGSLILMSDQIYEEMMNVKDSALCMNKFYPQITFSNLKLETTLKINSVELRLKEKGKLCHQKEGCQYFDKHKTCPLITEVYEYQILNEGEIKLT